MSMHALLSVPYLNAFITRVTHKLHAAYKYLQLDKMYKFITSSRDAHLGHMYIVLKQFLLLFSGFLGFFIILHAISFFSPAFIQDTLQKPLDWYYNRVFLKYAKYIKRYLMYAKTSVIV